MGVYLNPGNDGFAEKINTDYVDKTGLIALVNRSINTNHKLICISRPRRFGKSYAAQMLCAYYDKTCRSEDIFNNFIISENAGYYEHLNKYDVIYLDMTNILGNVTDPNKLTDFIIDNVTKEITVRYPEARLGNTFDQTLIYTAEHTGNKFIFIIDEWDAPIRETPEIQDVYLGFLRMLFKSSSTTPKIVAAAYMTGILPIKKDESQSAISDFNEYSMLDPREFDEFVGFTEEEVRGLCEKNGMDFSGMKDWYDGYSVGNIKSVYNPYSVMQAIGSGKYKSYWKKTTAAETLLTYIDMDEDGLQSDIARLIAGESIEVDTDSFQNDVETFTSKDDVLTLLVHLGYLTYEEVSVSYDGSGDILAGMVHIPNEEVRSEFENILRKANHKSLIDLIRKSDQLLKDTLEGNEEAVAKAIQEVHDSSYAPTFYNDEQSLRYVIKMAYLSCVDQYAKIEEMPGGHGIADAVFVPKKSVNLPAMIVELKWNKSADSALSQIYDRSYDTFFKGYGGDVVLVGISYDEKSKVHGCRIVRHSPK